MTARMLSLDLTLPPSLNACFVNVVDQGRVLSAAARAWKKRATMEISIQARGARFLGQYHLSVRLSDTGLSRDRDCDNALKLLLDAVVKSGAVIDDNHRCLRSIDVEWCSALPAGRCTVEVHEIWPEPLPKPTKALRPKDAVSNRAKSKAAAEPNSVMRALRSKGINVARERIRVQ